MYALIHNTELLLGPIGFNVRMITSVLEEELEVTYGLQPRQFEEVPIHINDRVHILPAIKIIPEYDEKTHNLGNFTWNIDYDENNIPVSVTFNYPLIEKSLEQVKLEKIKYVSPVRKEKENTTIQLNINGTVVKVSTSREQRLSFVSKFISSSGPHKFKFSDNIWLEIDNATIQYIVGEIDKKVQEAFNWELSKIEEINSCQTVDCVNNVIIREPVQPEDPNIFIPPTDNSNRRTNLRGPRRKLNTLPE